MSEGVTIFEFPSIEQYLSASNWRHALFTTYALSLSYLESEVLRPLIQAGCRDIWVVADAEGYRRSLMERRSSRVGQEYRLIPSALPQGVMHAKCIYLVGDTEHLLLVGSGNLTFGGHGKNAEVFEALTPDGNASAFEDFASFLESVATRPDIQIAQGEWADDFAGFARQAAADGSDADSAEPVRLIHSVDEPVVTQLPALAPDDGWRQATVMSPYHDPNGYAVRTLLKALDCRDGRVAVTSEALSPFPFADAGEWECPVAPVKMSVPEDRFVHAKWYELTSANDRYLLTGSINATRKALTTTDNVELGVLRRAPNGSGPIYWESASEPAFEAQNQIGSGLGNSEIVHARFDRDDPDKLRGALISLRDCEGQWTMRLVDAQGETFERDVELGSDGHFILSDSALEHYSQKPALQIQLVRDGREARGWVHNDMLLGIGGRGRLTAGAMSRLLRREGDEDDLHALLDYLSTQAENYLRLFDAPIKKGSGGGAAHQQGGQDIVSVHIEELAPVAKDEIEAGQSGVGGAGPTAADHFDRALAQLRRMLLGHGQARRQPLEAADDAAVSEEVTGEDDSEAAGRTPDQTAQRIGLDEFKRRIGEMIEDAEDDSSVRHRLLVVLLEVSMAMHLHQLKDAAGAHAYLASWFFKAARYGRPDPERVGPLEQHVVTSAATLATLATAEGSAPPLNVDYHETLERFYKAPVDPERANNALLTEQDGSYAVWLSADPARVDLAGALRDILHTPTRRQQLEEALQKAERGEAVDPNAAIFQSETGKALLAELRAPTGLRRIGKTPVPGYEACAKCYSTFPEHARRIFVKERMAQCIHCNKITVNTKI